MEHSEDTIVKTKKPKKKNPKTTTTQKTQNHELKCICLKICKFSFYFLCSRSNLRPYIKLYSEFQKIYFKWFDCSLSHHASTITCKPTMGLQWPGRQQHKERTFLWLCKAGAIFFFLTTCLLLFAVNELLNFIFW